MAPLPTRTLRDETEVLAFDLWDTLLDRDAKLVPALDALLDAHDTEYDPSVFLRRYLAMHFRDSLIDSLLPTPHTPFKTLSRRALAYRFAQLDVEVTSSEIEEIIDTWYTLDPFPDVDAALDRLSETYTLVGLSNGDPDMLRAVRSNFTTDLDGVLSVAHAGAYKPHPDPYEHCVTEYGVAPHEVLFVTAHTFDLVGAKAVGMRGAYLNRHDNPFGDWPAQPDLTVPSATDLADTLLA